MKRLIAALVVFFLLPSICLAWADAGHKIIASIAFRQLTAAEQAKIIEILKKHPRFEKDFKNKIPNELEKSKDEAAINEWIFQQAAVWPDIVRGFPEKDKDIYHKSTWHYINQPIYLTPQDETNLKNTIKINISLEKPKSLTDKMNIVQTIKIAREVLVDNKTSAVDKGVMMSWLFHTCGDIHQPLHSCAMFTTGLFPEGDKGGNSIITKQTNNLHALWDQFPGNNVDFRSARNDAIAAVNDQNLAKLGKTASTELSEDKWLGESYQLANTIVYDQRVRADIRAMEKIGPMGEKPPIMLNEEYLKTGGEACKLRLVQAGYRLGAILKEIANKK